MSIQGTYYDGKGSASQPGTLVADDAGIVRLDGTTFPGCAFRDMTIPSRLGNTPRLIQLPDGGSFEIRDNDALDRLSSQFSGKKDTSSRLFKMESSIPVMLGSVVLLTIVFLSGIFYGVPWLSGHIAERLPARFSTELAQGTLEQLDEYAFSRSQLPPERRKALTRLFTDNLPEQSDFQYQLHFRQGNRIGANALALPDGSVIVTDEFVELAENDLQILSVLYHEMGHIEHRHSMRTAIEALGVTAMFAWVLGQVELASDWLIALPTILMQLNYSRSHEWEADGYALQQMKANGHDPIHFADMMALLEQYDPDSHRNCKHHQPETDEGEAWGIPDFLSSHPPSEDRIERFRLESASPK